jgi:hypothetical protein
VGGTTRVVATAGWGYFRDKQVMELSFGKIKLVRIYRKISKYLKSNFKVLG